MPPDAIPPSAPPAPPVMSPPPTPAPNTAPPAATTQPAAPSGGGSSMSSKDVVGALDGATGLVNKTGELAKVVGGGQGAPKGEGSGDSKQGGSPIMAVMQKHLGKRSPGPQFA